MDETYPVWVKTGMELTIPSPSKADRWISWKSRGKMSRPEANSKEPKQTQSLFPLLSFPLGALHA
uniref:Uncharacterized protein n=1 Tax=Salix viminalis TaxID=40686 RepID=A0A6N2KAL3_SALVM